MNANATREILRILFTKLGYGADYPRDLYGEILTNADPELPDLCLSDIDRSSGYQIQKLLKTLEWKLLNSKTNGKTDIKTTRRLVKPNLAYSRYRRALSIRNGRYPGRQRWQRITQSPAYKGFEKGFAKIRGRSSEILSS